MTGGKAGASAPATIHQRLAPAWRYDDGGREAAGFRGAADDCVARAMAIALRYHHGAHDDAGEIYADVYREVAAAVGATGKPKSARNGVARKLTRKLFAERGWTWHPTMRVGQGTRVHLVADELPAGVIVCQVSRHVVAVVDGVPRDTYDPTRDGVRCVYGYWTAPA